MLELKRPKYYSPFLQSIGLSLIPHLPQINTSPNPTSLISLGGIAASPGRRHLVVNAATRRRHLAAAARRWCRTVGEGEGASPLSLSLCTHSSAPPAPPALRRAAFPLIAIAAIIVRMRRRGSHSHGDSTLGSGSANGHPAVAWCTRYRLHLRSWSLPWSPRGCPHGLAVAGGLRGSLRP